MSARSCLRTVLLFAFVFTLLPGLVHAQDKPIVAVFDMEDRGSGLDNKTLDILTDYLAVRLVTCFNVIPREQIRQRMTASKAESHKECYEQSCQVEMGRELAAQKSLSTKILKIADECTMTATLYDLKKSITDKAAMAGAVCDKKVLLKAVADIANELCGVAPAAETAAVTPPREMKRPRETKPPRKTASSKPPPKVKKKPEEPPPEVTEALKDVPHSWNARFYLGFLVGNEELYIDYGDGYDGYASLDTGFRLHLDAEVLTSEYLSLGTYFSYASASEEYEGFDVEFLNVGFTIKPRFRISSLDLRAGLMLGYQNISSDGFDESSDGLGLGGIFEISYWITHNIGAVFAFGFMGQLLGGNEDADVTHAPMFFVMFGAEYGG